LIIDISLHETGTDEFKDQAFSIQNGTHPSPPINPILPAMRDLQSEMEDIAVGFNTRMHQIQREGERAFSTTPADDGIEIEKPADAEFSILPVPDKEHTSGEPGPDIPPVIMSRSKEQILQALENAEAVMPEPKETADQDVENMAPAEARTNPVPVPAAADHEEL